MKAQFLPIPLLVMSALAACQTNAPTRNDHGGYGSGSASSFGYDDPAEDAANRQDPPPATPRQSAGEHWGPGTKHISLGGAFVDDQVEGDGTDPGDDIETLDVQAVFGVLISERFEINGQATYHELDIGVDDVNRVGLLAGLRYHFVVPTDAEGVGVYAEAKGGLLSVDAPSGDETEFAYGASGGMLWFPWGLATGMAINLAIDWLATDTIDRVGASLALAYYW